MSDDALYEFTADYATHLSVAIKKAGFSVRNLNIDAANFHALDYGRKRLRAALIEIPEFANPEFPFVVCRAQRMRLAEVREVLSFVGAFPKVAAGGKLVALGVLWRDGNDRRGAPVVHCRESDRRLELIWLGGWWGKRYSALAIRRDGTEI